MSDGAPFVLAALDLDRGRLTRDDREVLGAARLLADTLDGGVAMVAIQAPGIDLEVDPKTLGVDRLLLVRPAGFDHHDVETRAQAVMAAAAVMDARHIVFSDTLTGGGTGRRIAARWQDRPATSVVALGHGAVVCRQDGGRRDITRPVTRILVLAPQVFAEPVEPCLREARLVDVTMPDVQPLQLRPMEYLNADPATIPLTEAELILSAGNGVTDWETFHRLAAALGAAEGASRVVCDAGSLPRSRQIGASGVLVEPRCYLAFGIAGASQHLQGIAACERVVAVNTDIHAEMIKRADLSIIADVQAVMPALVRQLTGR